jgi:aryl-alcohol dehydrogenase-like predicted oxidoreductase
VDRLHQLAAEKGISAAQLALAWLLAQGQDVVPIPGTRTAARLAENLAAADVDVTPKDLARIEEIIPDGAAGARYTAEYLPTWV